MLRILSFMMEEGSKVSHFLVSLRDQLNKY